MAVVTQIAIFVLPFIGATDCYPGDASCCDDSTVNHACPTNRLSNHVLLMTNHLFIVVLAGWIINHPFSLALDPVSVVILTLSGVCKVELSVHLQLLHP